MIIKNLSIKGFGKLRDLNISLSSGLNIIYGKNESGKSTILSFIKAAFYGVDKKSKKDEMTEFDKYKPWNSEEYAGMIEYEIDNHIYKIGRNFNINKVSICNELWEDVSELFPKDKKSGPLFAHEHIGLSEELFKRTIFISQKNNKIIDNNKEIMDRLINIQQTGEEDISLNSAISILENGIKEKIGNNKSKKRPINIIEEQIHELEKSKNEAIALRNNILELEAQIKEKENEKNIILFEYEKAKGIKESLRQRDVIEAYNKAIEYENNLESLQNEMQRLKQFENFPGDSEERLRDIVLEIKKYDEHLTEKGQQIEALRGQLSNLSEFSSKDIHISDIILKLELLKHSDQERQSYINELKKLQNNFKDLHEELSTFGNLPDLQKQILVKTYERQLSDLDGRLNKMSNIIQELKELEQNSKSISATVIDKDSKTKSRVFLYDIESILEKYDDLVASSKKIDELKSQLEKSSLQNVPEKSNTSHAKTDKRLILRYSFLGIVIIMILLGTLFSSSTLVKSSLIVIGFISVLGLIFTLKNNKSGNNKKIEYTTTTDKIDQLEELNNHVDSLQKEIIEVLNIFEIQSNQTQISDEDISLLKNKFVERANMPKNSDNSHYFSKVEEDRERISNEIGHFLDNNKINLISVESLYNDLEIQKQNIISRLERLYNDDENAINEIDLKERIKLIEDIDYHNMKISQLEEEIKKSQDKINKLIEYIKPSLNEYSIYIDNELHQEDIEAIKGKLVQITQSTNESIKISTLLENLEQDIQKLREKISVAHNEKNKILEVSQVKDEQEYLENIEKRKRYLELEVESKRLKDIHYAYQNGQSSKELIEKIKYQQDFEQNLFEYDIESVENDINKFDEQLKEINEKLLHLNSELNSKINGKMALNEIVEKIEELKLEKSELEEKRASIETAIDIMKEVSFQIQKDFSPKFQRELSRIIGKITDEKYNKVNVGNSLVLNTINQELGQIVNIENLSVGTIEQFYFALRITLANLLSTKENKLPLFIDEVFVYFDDTRVKNAIEFLLEEAKSRQVIIFTCQNREIDAVKDLGLDNINLVQLSE